MGIDAEAAEGFKRRQIAVYSTGDPTFLARRQEPIAISLVEAAAPSPADVVLDVGAGTGNVAVVAARRGARVTATDLTPRQVQLGRERSAAAGFDITWAEADAEQLPFPDHSFTQLLSSFGMVFAPRPEVAAREAMRVTRPGGLIGYTMHASNSFNGETRPLVARFLPDMAPDPVDAFAWTDVETVRSWFAGCAVTVSEHVDVGERYASIDAWWRDTEDNVPMVTYIRSVLDDDAFAQFRDEFVELALRHADLSSDGSLRRRSAYVIGLITRP
ncbi:MAG TPA: class I SAM-dependent methyltransferase [Jatrophihabitans sp.]|jgi:ubiquinone/menaquinone biosynthesis C-methylase UbiE|nr:class I SAM-dependent methyltransferase [Jatrophihabitans sp.]